MESKKSYTAIKVLFSYVALLALVVTVGWFLYSENVVYNKLEDKIAFERKKFNDIVNDYNASIATFPALITAKMFGFTPKGYFAAEAGTEKVPTVKF